MEKAPDILARVPADLDTRMERFVLDAADLHGFDTQERAGKRTWYVEFGADALVEHLPGVPGGTRWLGTFDRDEAVLKEDLDFFASGHALVEGLFRELQEGARGRAGLLLLEKTDASGAGLLFVFRRGAGVEAVAVGLDGTLRPEWAELILRRRTEARGLRPEDWLNLLTKAAGGRAPDWASLVRRLSRRGARGANGPQARSRRGVPPHALGRRPGTFRQALEVLDSRRTYATRSSPPLVLRPRRRGPRGRRRDRSGASVFRRRPRHGRRRHVEGSRTPRLGAEARGGLEGARRRSARRRGLQGDEANEANALGPGGPAPDRASRLRDVGPLSQGPAMAEGTPAAYGAAPLLRAVARHVRAAPTRGRSASARRSRRREPSTSRRGRASEIAAEAVRAYVEVWRDREALGNASRSRRSQSFVDAEHLPEGDSRHAARRHGVPVRRAPLRHVLLAARAVERRLRARPLVARRGRSGRLDGSWRSRTPPSIRSSSSAPSSTTSRPGTQGTASARPLSRRGSRRVRRLHAALTDASDRALIRRDLAKRLVDVADVPWWAMGKAELAELVKAEDKPGSLVKARALALEGARTYPRLDRRPTLPVDRGRDRAARLQARSRWRRTARAGARSK